LFGLWNGQATEESMMTETNNAIIRQTVIALLRKGVGTQGELAAVSGKSRQLIHYWVKQAGIDPAAARNRRLARLEKRARARMQK
jgi:hypothetical protein